MISFQNVSFTYAESGNGGVLDLNLVVRSGECVLLCGPSGCGKTTVTRLANGLIPHFFHGNLSGQVNVNGMDTRETEIAALSDAVGTVFQNPRTQFFNTDTDSEIVFGLENRGIPREALRSRLDELTEELHLTSGLDLKSMEEVGILTRSLATQGKVLLIITHDIEFMMRICTRILFIRDGEIVEDLSGGQKEKIVRLLRGEE